MIGEKLSMVALFLAAMAVVSVTYVAVIASAARALRLGVASYELGFGPTVLHRGTFTLRLVPLSASFVPMHRTMIITPPAALLEAIERGELRYYDDLPFVAQIAFTLVSPAASFVTAALILGPGAASRAIVSDARDYVLGVLGPLTGAPHLLREAHRAYQMSPLVTTVGRDFALVGAFGLLTLPNTLLFLLSVRGNPTFWPKFRAVVMLVNLATGIAWCVGFAVWLLGS